jgi:Ser/Thr protein kinase RdoA (MazF antagonist)
MPDLEYPARIAARFAEGAVVRAEPLGRGLINDTFLIHGDGFCFVLQRINRRVFPDPMAIMANLRLLTDHARRGGSALRLPGVLAARDGGDCHRDERGDCWRALEYIEDACVLPALAGTAQAEEVGRALGRFHVLATGIDPGLMREALPGFHVAPDYLARLDAAARPRPRPDPEELGRALEFVAARRDGIDVLERAKHRGWLRLRVVHGDPKLDNVLFDRAGVRAVSLVDLDTVQPGLVHTDIGDCLRSCCNRSGDAAGNPDAAFDLGLCRAILGGYLDEARGLLTPADREYLYPAIRLLPLELGIRFLADHLDGDVYFKVEAPGQNLRRALAQFRLAESVERQEGGIRSLIAALA